jgi:hypothetical protein
VMDNMVGVPSKLQGRIRTARWRAKSGVVNADERIEMWWKFKKTSLPLKEMFRDALVRWRVHNQRRPHKMPGIK